MPVVLYAFLFKGTSNLIVLLSFSDFFVVSVIILYVFILLIMLHPVASIDQVLQVRVQHINYYWLSEGDNKQDSSSKTVVENDTLVLPDTYTAKWGFWTFPRAFDLPLSFALILLVTEIQLSRSFPPVSLLSEFSEMQFY